MKCRTLSTKGKSAAAAVEMNAATSSISSSFEVLFRLSSLSYIHTGMDISTTRVGDNFFMLHRAGFAPLFSSKCHEMSASQGKKKEKK